MPAEDLTISNVRLCVDSLVIADMNPGSGYGTYQRNMAKVLRMFGLQYLILSTHDELWSQAVCMTSEDPNNEELREELSDKSLSVVNAGDQFIWGVDAPPKVEKDKLPYLESVIGYRTELYLASRGLVNTVSQRIVSTPEFSPTNMAL